MTIDEMRDIKEKKGYTYTQICDYSGVPIGTIIKIFAGQTLKPRRSTLDAIEKMLTDPKYEYLGKRHSYDDRSKTTNNSYENIYGENIVMEEAAAYVEDVGKYTVEDYLNLPEGTRVELIDGKFYDMASPTVVHQDIIYRFVKQVDRFIDDNKGKCKVFIGPVDVQLDNDDKTMVVPDAVIICDSKKNRKDRIIGAPDLVLEVLSPSTRNKDMEKKCPKYRMAGVKEYWMIDPKKKVLIKYDFTDEDYLPKIVPLKGEEPLVIYKDKCLIDLDEIGKAIQ